MALDFTGVHPAITTPFRADGSVDHAFLQRHIIWMLDAGCRGIIPLGSLGEGATLTASEKREILRTCVDTCAGRAPVIPGIAGLSTVEAVQLIEDAERMGCRGAMVLPPYAYSTDWREMRAHVEAVIRSTSMPCILYNNPIAYKTDFLPEQIVELAAAIPNLSAVKESSGDVRRVTALKALLGGRLTLMMGVDDLIVEGVRAGVSGWVAGLVNAFPKESVALFNFAPQGKAQEADDLYRWFLPLLRLDVAPKFVQLIKLAQEKVGMGCAKVRAPRLELVGEELHAAERTIEQALLTRPTL